MPRKILPLLQEESFASERCAVWSDVVSSLLSQAYSEGSWVISNGRLLCSAGSVAVVDMPAPYALRHVQAVGQKVKEGVKLPSRVVVNSCGVYSSGGTKLADWVLQASLPREKQPAGVCSPLTEGFRRDIFAFPADAHKATPFVIPHEVEEMRIHHAFLAGRLLVLTSAHFLMVIALNIADAADGEDEMLSVMSQFSFSQWREALVYISPQVVPFLLKLHRHAVDFSLVVEEERYAGVPRVVAITRGDSSLVFYPAVNNAFALTGAKALTADYLVRVFDASRFLGRTPLPADVARRLRLLRKIPWSNVLADLNSAKDRSRLPVLYRTQQWELGSLYEAKKRLASGLARARQVQVLAASLVTKLLGGDYPSWTIGAGSIADFGTFYRNSRSGLLVVLLPPFIVPLKKK